MPKEDFTGWQRRRAYTQDGTQTCDHCFRALAVQRCAQRTHERLRTLRRRLQNQRKEEILAQVRLEILDVVARRGANSCLPSVPQESSHQVPEQTGEECRNQLAPAVRQPDRKTYTYICPYCNSAVRSTVCTGRIDAPGQHCGARFRVKDGQVQRSFQHVCPTCGANVQSKKPYGRITAQHSTPAGKRCRCERWNVQLPPEAGNM